MRYLTPMITGIGMLLTSFGAMAAGADAAPAAPAMLPRYPVRAPAAPAKVESGKGLYSVNCSFCHGATAKGGETGPSLVRSEIVLNDKDGELIGAIVQNGVPGKGMPKFVLTQEQVSDIAAFIHSFPVGEGARADSANINPLVGNAEQGRSFFNGAGKCANCHSVDGDLKGIGSRFSVRDLQGDMLTGGRHGGPMTMASFFAAPVLIPKGTTVTVSLTGGKTYRGELERIDEFEVSLIDATTHESVTLPRQGDTPKVEIRNPMQPHLDLLRVLTDADIHNLTAYLVTLK